MTTTTYAEYRQRPVWARLEVFLAMPDLPATLRDKYETEIARRSRPRRRRPPLPKCEACGRPVFPGSRHERTSQ